MFDNLNAYFYENVRVACREFEERLGKNCAYILAELYHLLGIP